MCLNYMPYMSFTINNQCRYFSLTEVAHISKKWCMSLPCYTVWAHEVLIIYYRYQTSGSLLITVYRLRADITSVGDVVKQHVLNVSELNLLLYLQLVRKSINTIIGFKVFIYEWLHRIRVESWRGTSRDRRPQPRTGQYLYTRAASQLLNYTASLSLDQKMFQDFARSSADIFIFIP